MPSYKSGNPEEGGAFKHVEPGEYPCRIVGAKEKISEAGNDMIVLSVEIQGGPIVNEHLVFTEKASWKIDQVRAAIGEAVIEGEQVLITPDRFVGKSARVVVIDEPGKKEDVKFNKIERWILPAKQDDIPF